MDDAVCYTGERHMIYILRIFTALLIGCLFFIQGFAVAQIPEQSPFSIQVSPSPIIDTIAPGTTKHIELSIRNTSTQPERLKIEARSFTANQDASEVTLGEDTPPEIGTWITFSQPVFSVRAGEVFIEKISIDVPKEAGFSYAFAFVISRADEKPAAGASALKGSVAVFTLLNVERDGATRAFELESFRSSRRAYEYVPVQLEISLKNTGNTIAQPYGTVYIQRSKDDPSPIDTLPVNPTNGSVLPGDSRTFRVEWDNGFPVYKNTTEASNAKQAKHAVWDWSQLDKFRIGRYTAKVVVAYNDGQRDVPLESVLEFWIIPWKIIVGILFVVGLIGFGLYAMVSKIWGLRRRSNKQSEPSDDKNQANI